MERLHISINQVCSIPNKLAKFFHAFLLYISTQTFREAFKIVDFVRTQCYLLNSQSYYYLEKLQYCLYSIEYTLFTTKKMAQPKGISNQRYTPKFKTGRRNQAEKKLNYREPAKRFEVSSDTRTSAYERIYLTKVPAASAIEREDMATVAG